MPRELSPIGVRSLMRVEGFVGYAYDDADQKLRHIMPGDHVAGILTIGYGHTGKHAKPGATITKLQASALLAEDLIRFNEHVDSSIKALVAQNVFDACVILCYNIGRNAFSRSTALKLLNYGDSLERVGEALKLWNKTTINGRKVISSGLITRRKIEHTILMRGIYPVN